jgi:rhodanese-related sulfurtransferase
MRPNITNVSWRRRPRQPKYCNTMQTFPARSAIVAACRKRRVPMATNVKQMLEAANAAVPKITPDQAADMIKAGNTLILDVRDAPEVATSGKVAGALNVSRGMLEFRADPDSPYHDKTFDKGKTVILYCASGGRSALAGKVLKDMGYEKVYNVGGFKDWTGAVEK